MPLISTGSSRGPISASMVASLGLSKCIDWIVLKTVHLANDVRALLETAPWDRLFAIIEPTYSELTLEFCSTFHLQHVMVSYNESRTISFQLGGRMRF